MQGKMILMVILLMALLNLKTLPGDKRGIDRAWGIILMMIVMVVLDMNMMAVRITMV